MHGFDEFDFISLSLSPWKQKSLELDSQWMPCLPGALAYILKGIFRNMWNHYMFYVTVAHLQFDEWPGTSVVALASLDRCDENALAATGA